MSKKIYATKAEQNRAGQARFKARNPEKYKSYLRKKHLKKKFGITLEEYQAMFVLQEGNCAICGRNQSLFRKALAVDHDHETGKVRALLCINCNMVLGGSRESKDILKNCIKYIKQYAPR